MYELIVTTFRGLYRLRLWDIVKVVGFHYTSPQVEFVMRAPSSSGQIVTEKDLLSAMAGFQLMLSEEFGAEILDFSSFMHTESEKKQLKIFVEVKDVSGLLQNDKFTESVDVRRKCCSVVEEGLGGLYQVMRARGDVVPLSVSIARSGSFDLLLEEALRNGAPASQYKPPKIIKNHKIFNILESSVAMTL